VFYKLNNRNTFALALLPINNLVVSRNLWVPPGNFLPQPPLFRDGSMGCLGTEPAHPFTVGLFLVIIMLNIILSFGFWKVYNMITNIKYNYS